MVQANLEGRKTQTRRVNGLELINDDPDRYIWLNEYPQAEIPRPARPYDDRYYYAFTGKNNNSVLTVTHCPYGKPGDILWVRESWKLTGWDYEVDEAVITYTDGKFITHDVPDGGMEWVDAHVWKLESRGILKSVFGTEDDHESDDLRFEFTDKKHPYSPSIHMPKWATRIFLRVKSVQVERLQDIGEQDAIAEGIKHIGNDLEFGATIYPGAWFNNYGPAGYSFLRPVESFRSLWECINGSDSWKANPWVWVIEFERIEKPENWPA